MTVDFHQIRVAYSVWWGISLVLVFLWDLYFSWNEPVWIHVVRTPHGRSIHFGYLFTFYLTQLTTYIAMYAFVEYAGTVVQDRDERIKRLSAQFEEKTKLYQGAALQIHQLTIHRNESDERVKVLERELEMFTRNMRTMRESQIDVDALNRELADCRFRLKALQDAYDELLAQSEEAVVDKSKTV